MAQRCETHQSTFTDVVEHVERYNRSGSDSKSDEKEGISADEFADEVELPDSNESEKPPEPGAAAVVEGGGSGRVRVR